MSIGCFLTINVFLAVDLTTNLVHYSRNLSKQMLRFYFHKYQTVPSTYMSMKPNFCCLLCTKHSPSTRHRQASLPKAYRAMGNRDKTLQFTDSERESHCEGSRSNRRTSHACHFQSTLDVAIKKCVHEEVILNLTFLPTCK